MSIATTKLLPLASDPYGLPLTISSVSTASANGGAVVLDANADTYTCASGYIGEDRFAYTIGNDQGSFASAEVFIQVQYE